jgi:sigma-E processing peptidase SpoIIGA
LGGTIFALFFAIVANLKTENGTFVYTSNIPIGFFVVVAGVFFKFFYDSLKIARSRQELTEKIFVLRIYHKHKKIEINAFLDTGNVLIDNVTKAPVTVISFKVFQKLFNVKTIEFLKGNYKIENSRYIPVTDALKTSKMLVFNVDKIEVVQNGVASIINNPLLGLSTSNFSSKLLCDAIIGETFLKLGEVNV